MKDASEILERNDAGGPSPTTSASSGRELDAVALINAIQELRKLPRVDPKFWDEFCALMRLLCRASSTLLVHRITGDTWELLGKNCPTDQWLLNAWQGLIIEHSERLRKKGYAFTPMQDDFQRQHIFSVVRISGIEDSLLLIDIPERERQQVNELILRALLAADFPAEIVGSPTSVASPTENQIDRATDEGILDILDLAAQVLNEQKFGAATLVLVNGLAAHFKSTQACIGFLKGNRIQVAAISHLDKFERNTDNIQLLEEAFLDMIGRQDVYWFPKSEGDGNLDISREELSENLGFAEHCLIPLHDRSGRMAAVGFLGFQEPLHQRPKLDQLIVIMELLQPWLQTLQQRDRWWGARLATTIMVPLDRFVGPRHIWRRTLAAMASILLLFVTFGRWDYHIEAASQLTTDSTRFISAQYDSRVEEVFASAGDVVKEGAVLAVLDTKELRQQEMDIRADRQRLAAEADKSRAAGSLPELEIALARYAQAEARLNRVVEYLAQSKAIAPFDGVIVDGERKELLNAPVKKGDRLFRLARTEGLYVELLVPEREIRFVEPNATGQLRLLSRPNENIPFKVSVLIPVAQVKGQEGNHFLIKAKLQQEPEEWWRPGMSGTALIDGGKQNIAWILTHKALDTLRMKLWWFW